MNPAAQLVAMVVGGASGEPGWAVSACRVVMRSVAPRSTRTSTRTATKGEAHATPTFVLHSHP